MTVMTGRLTLRCATTIAAMIGINVAPRIAIARDRPRRNAIALSAAPKPIASEMTVGAACHPANVAEIPLTNAHSRLKSRMPWKSGAHGIAQMSAETISIAEMTGVRASVVSDPPNAYW